MTVTELIEKLKEMPPDSHVMIQQRNLCDKCGNNNYLALNILDVYHKAEDDAWNEHTRIII